MRRLCRDVGASVCAPNPNDHSWVLAELSVTDASGLSDVDSGKNDGPKWRITGPFRYRHSNNFARDFLKQI